MYLDKIEIVNRKLLELLVLEKDITYIGDVESNYFQLAVAKSHFIYRCYCNSIKLFTIDLCKLLNKKEFGNIIELMDSLIKEYSVIKWENYITLDELHELRAGLNNIIGSEDFRRMKNARNKYYAHDDINKDNFKTTVEFKKMWEITTKLQIIFNRINYCYQNTTQVFEFTQKPFELELIARYHLIRDVVYEEYKENRDIGKMTKVLNILRGRTM